MNEEFINIQSSQTVSFLDKNIGALICNDIGNRNYDNIYAEAMDEYKRTHAGSFNPEDIVFHNMMTEKLNNNPNITAIYGYKLIDFASGAYDGENYNDECGFQGGIYYNETTGDYVVVCRGTEFDFSSEERYRDFVKTDVCGFGQDEIPDDFKETKKLLDNLLKNGVAKSQIHIVGHSLGGGVAQMLGAMDDYKDIDVTTYNAVGVEHLLNDMQSAGYVLQTNAKNASNINNYATCNDFVSTIFNIIGNKIQLVEPNNKNHVLQNAGKIITDDVEEYMKIILSAEYAQSGHGIDNFIDTNVFNSFTPCDDLHIYKTITDVLKILKGDFITINLISRIVGALLNDPNSKGNKVLDKIFKTGDYVVPQEQQIQTLALMNDSTLVGGISMVATPDEYDYFCRVLIDEQFKFVAKYIDDAENVGFYIDENSITVSQLDELVTNSKYFEIYNDGQEFIYNRDYDPDTLYIYQKTGYSIVDIRNMIIATSNLHVAVLNEDVYAGTSILIGDTIGNSLVGGDGRTEIYGESGNDYLEGNDGNDKMCGVAGNDTLYGGKGNDDIRGSQGYDTYIFYTGDGNDVIKETNQTITSVKGIRYNLRQGQIQVDGAILTGGTWDETTQTYVGYQSGVTYSWSGVDNTQMIINYGNGDTIKIANFDNGDLGLFFDREIITDKDDIPDRLTRMKQVYADLQAKDRITDQTLSQLKYKDANGKIYNIINCENTEKLIDAFGENIGNATIDTDGNYILIEEGTKLLLNHTPVDYSSLVAEIRDIANGKEVNRTELAIQGSNIYIPTSSSQGSPTLQDVYYQYTTKPSGGGLLSGLFTIVQLAACLITQQWWGAAFVALNSGIAGKEVAKISNIVDKALMAVSLVQTGIKGLSTIITSKGKPSFQGSVTGGSAPLDNIFVYPDGSCLVNGVYYTSENIPTVALNHSIQDANKVLYGSVNYDNILENATKFKIPDITDQYSPWNALRAFDVLVNQNGNPNNEYSPLYSLNATTGSISGSVKVDTSDVLAPDVSTPDNDENFKLTVSDRGCPLIFDLDGDGVETLDIDNSNVYFNTQNTEFSTKTGWVSGDDGLLAIDKNGDGKITQQSELFGTEQTSGFDILANYDTNNDGIIDANDAQFNSLKLWQDANENGITDAGELKSLTEAGISSIKLNPSELNIEQNQNTITGVSSYTKSDGTVGLIYNVNLAFNKIYTQYTGDYEISVDVIDMPWLRGYGQVEDLQLKMSNDESFKAYVKELTTMDDAKQIYDKMDEFLAKWVGCENISADAEVNGINQREVAILNKYLNLGIEGEIVEDKKVFIDSSYLNLKNKIYANFIAQTKLGDAFEINYDYKTDSMLFNDNTYEKLVTNLPDQKNFYASYIIAKVLSDAEALDGNKLAYTITEKGYGASLISYLNSGLQILENGEISLVDPNAPMYVIGTSGDDTITGTDNADIIYGMDGNDILNGGAGDDYLSGGNGNDLLIGGDGNDTMDGGSGDDTMQGGYGDDVYIYDGQGKDDVVDERWVKIARQQWYQSGWWIFKTWKYKWVYQDQLVDAGNDTIIFGDDVEEKDVTISKNGNDLVFELKGTDNKLTIKNWYTSTEQRVENFVFADGFVINSEQIINIITDTANADNLKGSSNGNYIISTAGNDSITGGKGDDAIINYAGNTTYYYNLGDGNDIIMDYNGNDKIVLGADIKEADVSYYKNNTDLVISIKNMTESITILNWFSNDNNKIESIEYLSSGKILTPDAINNSISTTIATGYDDVIIGNSSDNLIDGLAGNDYIEGLEGNDTIIGGLGKDIMKGGLGNDTYYVDNLGDSVVEKENEGNDTINTAISYELPDNVENLILVGSRNINGKGNNLNNTITGNDGDNIIDGVSGINTLQGGKGDDTYIINSTNANDVIIENADEGDDTVQSSITYTLNMNNVENLVLTGDSSINGTGNDLDNYIVGNEQDNILSGNAGNDILYGGGGKDTLKGGIGDDTYIIDSAETAIIENSNEGIDTIISNINYTLGANIENLVLAGSENLTGTGNSSNNTITGNDYNNTFIGGSGNDTLQGGTGADTYIFNRGDGQDVIDENSPNSNAIDKIKFGANITQNDIEIVRQGYDLILSIKGTSDKITIKKSNLVFGSRIERFEFADGSYIDGNTLYTITNGNGNYDTIYSDISYLNLSSKASAIDREYYESGKLLSEKFYNEQGIVYQMKTYDENGILNATYDYNSLGNITVENHVYPNGNMINKTEYTYNSSNQLITEKYYLPTGLQTTIKHSYDASGLLTQSMIYKGDSTSNILNKIKYEYNANRQLTKQTTYEKNTSTVEERLEYTYDGAGRIINKKLSVGYNKMTISSTGKQQYSWATRTQEEITYTYNANGKLTNEVTYSEYNKEAYKTVGGTKYGYIVWDTRKSKDIAYTYDANNNITNKKTLVWYNQDKISSTGERTTDWTSRVDENVTYTYNSIGQVTNIVTYGAYSKQSYKTVGGTKYGYITWDTHKTSEVTYTYNDMNNITNKKTLVWYDKLTNISSSGEKTYTWSSRVQENIVYEYNEYGLITNISTYNGYSELTSKKVGATTYTYNEWKTRKSAETVYTYNEELKVTEEKIYKYHFDNSNNWVSYVAERYLHTYDENGNIILTKHYNEGKLVEATKYEYTYDDAGYLINQAIYKANITNNNIASYTKTQDIAINSYYNNLVGGDGNETLNGAKQSDNLFGGNGSDVLYGNAGNDTLDGGAGVDLLIGGTGDDTYIIDDSRDIIVERANEGIDTVQVGFDYTLKENFENLTLSGTSNINGNGNGYANIVTGNTGNNILHGYDGNDILEGQAGNDQLFGDNQNDTLIGGTGNDTLYGGIGDDSYVFSQGAGSDTIDEEAGKQDSILLDASINKEDIAIYTDGNNMVIDYGSDIGTDKVVVLNQFNNSDKKIEQITLSDGSYLTDSDVNILIQSMNAYAANNDIQISSINDVKNNADLMNLVAAAWHN